MGSSYEVKTLKKKSLALLNVKFFLEKSDWFRIGSKIAIELLMKKKFSISKQEKLEQLEALERKDQ